LADGTIRTTRARCPTDDTDHVPDPRSGRISVVEMEAVEESKAQRPVLVGIVCLVLVTTR
jgi:hypothetical protein